MHGRLHSRLHGQGGDLSIDVEWSAHKGALTLLHGPSGSGKSTMLRFIAGLFEPDEGTLSIEEETWYNSHNRQGVVPQKRNVAFVFQNPALFPNMTVRQNLEYPAKTSVDTQRWLEKAALGNLVDQRPGKLSGGQQQKVAILRALIQVPTVLLLDEPFSAMDKTSADQMLKLIQEFRNEHPCYTFIVSHQTERLKGLVDQSLYLFEGRFLKD